MPEHVIFCEAERVLHVRLNRPEKKNALTRAMYQTLADVLQRAEADPAVRAVTISGTGEAFTSGNDLEEFLAGHPLDAESPAIRFLSVVSGLRKPCSSASTELRLGSA